MSSANQTDYVPKFTTETRGTSTPSNNFQSSNYQPGPPPPPPSGASASSSSNPLGRESDLYLAQNFMVANTQHITDRLNPIDRRQILLAQTQASHLGPNNTFVQQAFVNIDARQATQNRTFTVINPTEYTSGGQSGGGNPPPPPPAAGAVRMITDALPHYQRLIQKQHTQAHLEEDEQKEPKEGKG